MSLLTESEIVKFGNDRDILKEGKIDIDGVNQIFTFARFIPRFHFFIVRSVVPAAWYDPGANLHTGRDMVPIISLALTFLSICHRQETAFSIIRLIGRVYCALIGPAAYFSAPQRAVQICRVICAAILLCFLFNKFDGLTPVGCKHQFHQNNCRHSLISFISSSRMSIDF